MALIRSLSFNFLFFSVTLKRADDRYHASQKLLAELGSVLRKGCTFQLQKCQFLSISVCSLYFVGCVSSWWWSANLHILTALYIFSKLSAYILHKT